MKRGVVGSKPAGDASSSTRFDCLDGLIRDCKRKTARIGLWIEPGANRVVIEELGESGKFQRIARFFYFWVVQDTGRFFLPSFAETD